MRCPKGDALEKQLAELRQVVARGFGQLAKSSDPAIQRAADQVTQTLKVQNRRAATPKRDF